MTLSAYLYIVYLFSRAKKNLQIPVNRKKIPIKINEKYRYIKHLVKRGKFKICEKYKRNDTDSVWLPYPLLASWKMIRRVIPVHRFTYQVPKTWTDPIDFKNTSFKKNSFASFLHCLICMKLYTVEYAQNNDTKDV